MSDLETAPADVFKTFVNKLGHICDNAKGGKKVTAFAILQLGTIQYYFTSNQRDEEDYRRTSSYITSILNTLDQMRDDETLSRNASDGRLPRLLRMIIRFNQSRIKGYICRMREELDFCINFVRGDRSNEGQAVLQSLEYLKPLLEFSGDACNTNTNEFVDGSQKVIQAISLIYEPFFKEFLRLRTQNNMDRNAPWVVVSHSIGRLLSYYYAVNILIAAHRTWPQLFVDFEVHWVPSTAPREPSIPRRLDAAKILGKMSSDEDTISKYRDYAVVLEQSGITLNAKITEAVRHNNFLPFVHAEVNLLDYILRLQKSLREQGNEIPTFFLNDRYIGCSKPTCRLCELYFDHHPSGVVVRQGHRNMYSEWRAPDVFAADCDTAARERKITLERMIPIIRDEAFLNLREKFATSRPNDSHDTPSNVPPLDVLVSQMNHVVISNTKERGAGWAAWDELSFEPSAESADSAPELTGSPTGDEDGDIDDDSGGAKL
ncbi:hypothetical protein C8A00DRAFT_38459 [Chaetomidium leptoderma]|uniref:Uncharacterized protein n=1 Tax=Chaetomidium leptoderma TaxID=669021 RepID=A0AAN6ZU16_9PEZI|nr:hypothetical protein C8A00DRAFT_38459 [Chaetomidium leptoderma]